MEQILVYSDSLTWGIIPNTRRRLAFSSRWPGVLERTLNGMGAEVRVVENCLNGRRTVWDDPFKPGRNGAEGLAQVIEMHSPLSLVVLMLGTNDFQCTHDNNAWLSAQGMAALVREVRNAPIEPEMPIPEIMIVAPPKIVDPRGAIAAKFSGADRRSVGLAEELKQVATANGTFFLDSSEVTAASRVDGIHLDEDQHDELGRAVAKAVAAVLKL